MAREEVATVVARGRVEESLLRVPEFATPHAFSTRIGGVSEGPYAALNLSLSVGDDPERVARNRQRIAKAFGTSPEAFALLEQVHGTRVVEGSTKAVHAADAHVSNDPSIVLAISTADCVPILFFDPDSGAVGAAHCGWRGTVGNLASITVGKLEELYGSRRERVQAAIGPAICGKCYQVGDEVAERVRALGDSSGWLRADSEAGKWRLDLAQLNRHLLLRAGLRPESVHLTDQCTSCNEEHYFSYRRDDGVTGRQWAMVAARPVGHPSNGVDA